MACALALTAGPGATGTTVNGVLGQRAAPPVLRVYVIGRVAVHYSKAGADAPPVEDRNRDGIPDYVQQAALAAIKALAVYRSSGFQVPARVEIRIKRLRGDFGSTNPRSKPMVTIGNRLAQSMDPYGRLRITVAHELFHLVELTYLPASRLPKWIAEGVAVAMTQHAFPHIPDPTAATYERLWVAPSAHSLFADGEYGQLDYGSAVWWRYLAGLSPRLLPAFFAALHRTPLDTVRAGIHALEDALTVSKQPSLPDVYLRFEWHLTQGRVWATPRPRSARRLLPTGPLSGTLPALSSELVAFRLRDRTDDLELDTGQSGLSVELLGARPGELGTLICGRRDRSACHLGLTTHAPIVAIELVNPTMRPVVYQLHFPSSIERARGA